MLYEQQCNRSCSRLLLLCSRTVELPFIVARPVPGIATFNISPKKNVQFSHFRTANKLTLDVEVYLLAASLPHCVCGLAGVPAGPGPTDLLQHEALIGQDHTVVGVVQQGSVLKEMIYSFTCSSFFINHKLRPISGE